MKTDDLIEQLAASLQPVSPYATARRFTGLIGIALLAAFVLVTIVFGIRADLMHVFPTTDFLIKLSMPVAVAVASSWALYRLGHPGMRINFAIKACVAPVVLLWVTAVWVLQAASQTQQASMIWGATWRSCPLNIALMATPILLATFVFLKGLAPTNLRLAGATAGWFSGALAAVFYSLHCPEMAIPFIALWYVLGMCIPTAIGAMLGPRLLKW